MTKTEELLARQARYNRIEYADDAFGRRIGVKMLKRSQALRVEEMAPALSGDEEVFDDKAGKTVRIPKIARLLMVASMCQIDETHYGFVKDRRELDARLDMLEDEGLTAVSEAWAKFQPPKVEGEDGEMAEVKDPVALAKN